MGISLLLRIGIARRKRNLSVDNGGIIGMTPNRHFSDFENQLKKTVELAHDEATLKSITSFWTEHLKNIRELNIFDHVTREMLNDVCERAITQYGFEAQIKMLFEEIGELIVAISQLRRSEKEITNAKVRSELADVFLMVWQMSFIYGNFENEIIFKIERLKKKLEKTIK